MLSENRRINALSLVAVGDFNPVIIQPFWLVSKKLIKEEEGASAKVELIHNELVQFQIGDWLNIQVTRDRFEVRTTQEAYFETVRDLVLSIFTVLKETPLRAFGINHTRHYTLDEKKYRELGDKLAPFSNWEGLFDKPEVLNVEILQKGKSNTPGGDIRIRIQPSDLIKTNRFSFMSHINNHFEITNARILVILLQENWQTTFGFADKAEQTLDKIIAR